MSDRITYILEILDKYSVNTKKFKRDLLGIKRSAESLNKTLLKTNLGLKSFTTNPGLKKTITQVNTLARSLEKVKMSSRGLRVGRGVNAMGESMAMMNTNLTSMMRLNDNMMSKIQKGQDQMLKREKMRPGAGQSGAGRSRPIMAGGGGSGVSFGGVAKAMGYYAVIDKAIQIPRMIHDTAIEMDGLRASFAAMIPSVKGLEKATSATEIKYLRGVGEKYGLKFQDLALPYMKMLTTGVDASLAKGVTEKVTAMGRLTGLKSPALVDTLRAIEQMLTRKTIQGQEFNLQMQQAPKIKALFYDAFYNLSQKHGMKNITKDNAPSMFKQYMSEGRMTSEPIIREVVRLIQENFGEALIKKSHILAGEEARLSNAFHRLGTTISDEAMPALKGLVIGLTSFVSGMDKFLQDRKVIKEFVKENVSMPRIITPSDAVIGWLFSKKKKEESKFNGGDIPNNPQNEKKITLEIVGTNLPDNMALIPSNGSGDVSIDIKRGKTLTPIGGY